MGDSWAGAGLDRGSALPLWAQLHEELRKRIAAGEFRDGFPTEAELTQSYGVSRHTVREALRRLAAAGLVVSERGRGTFLAPRFDQPLGTLYSLYRSIEEQGVAQHSDVLRLATSAAPAVAAELGVPPETAFVVLERLRFADGEPLAVDTAWVPASVGHALLEADFTRTALYDELARRCDVHVDGGQETITPVVPTAAQREQLGIAEGCGAFFLERLGTAGQQPVEYRQTIIRGDRYRFVARWSPTGAYQLNLRPTP